MCPHSLYSSTGAQICRSYKPTYILFLDRCSLVQVLYTHIHYIPQQVVICVGSTVHTLYISLDRWSFVQVLLYIVPSGLCKHDTCMEHQQVLFGYSVLVKCIVPCTNVLVLYPWLLVVDYDHGYGRLVYPCVIVTTQLSIRPLSPLRPCGPSGPGTPRTATFRLTSPVGFSIYYIVLRDRNAQKEIRYNIRRSRLLFTSDSSIGD